MVMKKTIPRGQGPAGILQLEQESQCESVPVACRPFETSLRGALWAHTPSSFCSPISFWPTLHTSQSSSTRDVHRAVSYPCPFVHIGIAPVPLILSLTNPHAASRIFFSRKPSPGPPLPSQAGLVELSLCLQVAAC